MADFPLPAPWRSFLMDVAGIETASAPYARLRDAFFAGTARALPPEAVNHWDADQESGKLVIECVDGAVIRAGYEIIGTHSAGEFLWANANPSIVESGAAKRVRDMLEKSGDHQLAGPDRLTLGLRDVRAILAVAGELLEAPNTFLACSRRVAAAMVLRDVSMMLAADREDQPGDRRSIGLLEGRARPVSPLAPLYMMNQMIQAQVDAHAVAPETLILFDKSCAVIHADYSAGRFDEALDRIAEGKRKLGRFWVDQEPAGWLALCEGACRLAKGERAAALQAFRDGAHAIVPPDIKVLRLGMARAATTEESRRSYLSGLYIGAPDWFAAHVSEEEARIVRAAQNEADNSRHSVPNDPEAVLRAALAERFAQELRAHEWSEEAERHGEEGHILCAADLEAEVRIDADYRALLLKWFDVPREPSMGSWSGDPSEDPSALQTLTATQRIDREAIFTATFDNRHGTTESFRYRLILTTTPMSDRPLWRLAEVWSVWPDEEIRLQ